MLFVCATIRYSPNLWTTGIEWLLAQTFRRNYFPPNGVATEGIVRALLWLHCDVGAQTLYPYSYHEMDECQTDCILYIQAGLKVVVHVQSRC